MYIASVLCEDTLTGRKVWACREIPSGEFGDEWVSGFVVIRSDFLSNVAELQLAESIKTTRQRRLMQKVLKDLGFVSAWGMRNGKKRVYKI